MVHASEGELHERTWMAFVANQDIWAPRQISEVQRNLATIARTIAKYEPVSLLVRKQDLKRAEALLGRLESHRYPIALIEWDMNDLWVRDTGPTFVVDGHGGKAAVDFNFNGWGEDQDYALDAQVAAFIAGQAGVKKITADLVLEGGCFEVDGYGTAIMTESCILNENRNPNVHKDLVECELMDLLGLNKIIWLKGAKGKDITDGHTDFYARFVKPGVVIVSHDVDETSYDYAVTKENINILQSATDAAGNALEVITLETPWVINEAFGVESFAAGYVGYYMCNDAIVMQKFGDEDADRVARQKLTKAFPDRHIEQIAIDGIASGGGSIHCATQQEPKV